MLRDHLLHVQCDITEGIGLMQLEGELIAESRYEPERILREWLEANVVRVIIEFEKVTHIDSAGLSTLLGALHRFRRQEGDLILTRLNPSLNAIFEITSMQRYFKIFGDVEDARRHFKQLPPPAAIATAATAMDSEEQSKNDSIPPATAPKPSAPRRRGSQHRKSTGRR